MSAPHRTAHREKMKLKALLINRRGPARKPCLRPSSPRLAKRRTIAHRLLPALLAASFLHVGCASRKQMTHPAEVSPSAFVSAEDAVKRLLRNYGDTTSLKVSGRIETALPGEKRRRRASMAVMIQKPDSVRMRAYRPLAPPLFEFISDGNVCRLYVPSRRAVYLSEDCRSLRATGNYVAISAEAVVAALCVLVDPEAVSSPAASVHPEGNLFRIDLAEETGAKKRIWIDSATGLATRQLLIDAGGRVQADIRYLEHAFEGDAAVPVAIEIVAPGMGSAVVLRISRFEINARPPDGAFDFLPPEGTDIFYGDADSSPPASP